MQCVRNLPLLAKLRMFQAALACLVVGLAVAFVFKPGTSSNASPGHSPAAQRAVAEVRAHLNRVSLTLLAYLQNPRPEQLEKIKSEGQAATRRLSDFKIAAQDDPARDLVQIDARFETLRSATLAVLQADSDRRDALEAVASRADAIERIFSKEILPGLKPNQLNAYARLRSAKDAQAEARLLTRSPNASWDEKPFLSALAELKGMTRGSLKSAVENVEHHFARAQAQSRRAGELDRIEKQLLERYEEAYSELDSALGASEPALSSDSGVSWPWAVALVLGLALWILGMIAVDRTLQKQVMAPIAQIARIADAAASGDLSREVDLWRRDEVGTLALSMNRLLAVLSRSENLVYHLAALVESSGDAIMSQTLDGTILSWNKGAQRVYGYSAEEVKGRNIAVISPDDAGAHLREVLKKVQRGESVLPFEAVHHAKDGRTVHALVRVAAVHDSTRQVIGVSFCAEDLTRPNAGRRGASKALSLPAAEAERGRPQPSAANGI